MHPIPAFKESIAQRAHYVRDHLPTTGLFAGQQFRISPNPFPLPAPLVEDLEFLGRILLQFNRAANLLYRLSVAGKQPAWVAHWLDRGKPASLVELQRSPTLKNQLPRVIRPDLLITDRGFAITELDSVPGGIGLTAWLNQTYAAFADRIPTEPAPAPKPGKVRSLKSVPHPLGQPDAKILGAPDGMLKGFASLFEGASQIHIVVSQEAATYQPEMVWLSQQLDPSRFHVRDTSFSKFQPGDAVYRFFELFDLPNVPNAPQIFDLARSKLLFLTPPPKAFLEEKMLFALLWNRNLREFWRQELGERFLERLLEWIPYSWVVDSAPLPPQGAIPELNLTDWAQLKSLSQKERQLILKISGFSESAWGARGVYLGSDLAVAEWSAAVDQALQFSHRSPFILQRYEKPRILHADWFDFTQNTVVPMPGRVRLCPYYFVLGEGDSARAHLGGVLATICPADKKIIHGMRDAILAPCARESP